MDVHADEEREKVRERENDDSDDEFILELTRSSKSEAFRIIPYAYYNRTSQSREPTIDQQLKIIYGALAEQNLLSYTQWPIIEWVEQHPYHVSPAKLTQGALIANLEHISRLPHPERYILAVTRPSRLTPDLSVFEDYPLIKHYIVCQPYVRLCEFRAH